jgi:protein O-GlcNAc transferase
MSLKEQIEAIHNSDILIGIHGAGMSHALFLPPTSGVVSPSP